MKKITLPLIILVTAGMLSAQTDADSIMRKSYSLSEADTMRSTLYMLLVDRNGNQTLRVMELYSRETPDGRDSYVEFISPADVRGTKFLTIGREEGEDDQRIWLPELGKIRKISSSGKGAKFMGSDLTYYDMGSRSISDSEYTLSGEEKVPLIKNGREEEHLCWIIDTDPVDPAVPYARTRVWVSQEDYAVYRTVMWNLAGEEIKTIFILEVMEKDGVIVQQKTAVSTSGGHKTLLQMKDIVLNGIIDSSLFTVRNLER